MVTGAGPETNGLPGLTRGRCRHLHDDHQVSTLQALVTIRQCNCHNGLGPGQEERGLRTVSHRTPGNLLPYGWK